jgi:hypothetical protein
VQHSQKGIMMGFKINTEIKPLNEREIELISQSELENSLNRLNEALQAKNVSRGFEEIGEVSANSEITEEIIAKMNYASSLL